MRKLRSNRTPVGRGSPSNWDMVRREEWVTRTENILHRLAAEPQNPVICRSGRVLLNYGNLAKMRAPWLGGSAASRCRIARIASKPWASGCVPYKRGGLPYERLSFVPLAPALLIRKSGLAYVSAPTFHPLSEPKTSIGMGLSRISSWSEFYLIYIELRGAKVPFNGLCPRK
jgi:hypothetical protein